MSIRHQILDATVSTIIEQYNDDLCWSLYCAYTANPIADPKSYQEFKDEYGSGKPQLATASKPDGEVQEMSDNQVTFQVVQAEKMLQGFTPPDKGD